MTTTTHHTTTTENTTTSEEATATGDTATRSGHNPDLDAPVPPPAQRMSMPKTAPDIHEAMVALDRAAASGLDPVVSELVRIRASQINGCAFCLDKHFLDARRLGVSERKANGIGVWRETSFFTARERAALALAEAVTKLGDHGVPDDVYDEAARLFDQDELARLIAMSVVINAWNRIGVTARLHPAHH